MVPIAVLSAVARDPIVEILFGSGRIRPGRPRPHRGHAVGVPGRPDRPRDDRRARPGVLRPAGHGDAGRGRDRRGRRQLHAGGRCSSGRWGCPGSPWPSRSRPGSRPSSCSRSCARACAHFWLGGMAAGRRGVGRRRAPSPGVAAWWLLGRTGDALGARPGPPRPARRAGGRQRGLRGRLCARVGRLADPRTAVYRRGHGRRLPPPGAVVTAADPPEPAPGTGSSRARSPARTSSGPRWATVKAVNGWTAHRIVAEPGAEAADRRPDPGPPAAPDAVGVRLRAARAGRDDLVRAGHRGLHGGRPRRPGRRRRPRVAPADRPRDRGRRPARSRRRPAPGAPGRRLAPGRPRSSRTRPGSSTCAPTRPRCGATCARSGGSTSTRPGSAGSRSSTPTATGSATSTGSTARRPTGPAS